MGKRKLADNPSPHLSAYLTSYAKYGKTTALLTLPRPLLIGDVDKGLESLFKRDVIPPEMLEDVDVFDIDTTADGVAFVNDEWKKGPNGNPYASVAMDSFTTFMNRIVMPEILKVGGREKAVKADWGLYLTRGLKIADQAHKVAMHPDGCHVVLTFHEADKPTDDDAPPKRGPAVSGQLFDILPGIPNYSLFLRLLKTGMDRKTGLPTTKRVFQTGADHVTPAGSRRYLPFHMEPDFTKLWEIANAPQEAAVSDS